MSDNPARYLIELQAPRDDDKPHLRLKRAIKMLGRCFRLKCISVAERPALGPPDAEGGPSVDPAADPAS